MRIQTALLKSLWSSRLKSASHAAARNFCGNFILQRSDSAGSETTPSGYGLGLAIAKAIADQHHATLSASSSAENGTTFSLFLPTAES